MLLTPRTWYWIRRTDGSVAPYRFHAMRKLSDGRQVGEFFVGSMIQTFPLSSVVGEARMPKGGGSADHSADGREPL